MDLDNLTALSEQAGNVSDDKPRRKVVKGRYLQADADFFCYECCHVDEPREENWKALKRQLEVKRAMAGAEFINVHVTLGLKGGREQIAVTKPYQEQRNDNRPPEVKERVNWLRNQLANYRNENTFPAVSVVQEADDALCQFQGEQIAAGGVESSVLMSGDKDLWMVDGWHIDPKTGRMYLVEGFGNTEYREVGNVKPKLVGEGTSWFWHQMLMGDKADNIAGLEKMGTATLNEYFPTKTYNPNRKPAACGEVKAVEIMKGITSDKHAAKVVYGCYKDYYGAQAEERFVEQGFLLWMRRKFDVADVLTFYKECGLNMSFSKAQLQGLQKFLALVKIQLEVQQ